MGEHFNSDLANAFAEVVLLAFEDECQRDKRDIDTMMRRLKDLSAYSLTHAEILERREGVELLALGMFFGMTSNPSLRSKNQERLALLTEETVNYQGQAEVIEYEITQRNLRNSHPKQEFDPQMRLI